MNRPATSPGPAAGEQRIPLWMLLTGLLVAGGVMHAVWNYTSGRDEADARVGFEARAGQIDIALRERVRDHEQALLGMSTLFASGAPVDGARWTAQFELLRIAENQPGFRHVGYAPHIVLQEKSRHEAALRTEGNADYAVHPPGERERYAPVAYVAPAGERQRDIAGFDLYHDPLRRDALDTARDRGRAVITRKLGLSSPQDAMMQASFLMVMPAYQRTAVTTVAQRRDAIQGYLFGAVRAADMMNGLTGGKQDLRIEVFDGALQQAEHLLYDSAQARPPAAPARFATLSTITLYGRSWSLRVSTLPEFEAFINYGGARVATASALLICLLALTMIWSQLTLRRRAEDIAAQMTRELASSREQLALALEGSDLALFDWHVGTGDVQLSAHWNVMLGGNAEAVRTTFAEFEALIPPEDQGIIHQQVAALIDGSSDRYRAEHRVRRRDGATLWIASRAKVVERDSMNRALRLVGTHVDITQRREMDRMKSEFISTVSHELRTPITAMIGALGLLRKGAVGPLPEKAVTFLDMAYQNGERLSLLVNDILTLGDSGTGRMSFRLQTVDVVPFFERAISMNAGLAERKNIRLAVAPDTPAARVRADSDRLMQVVANLLSNAIKFSPDGATVTLTAAQRGASVRISVIDRGSGIAPEFHSRLFERFMQADGSNTRAQGGTGLGLAVCKSLVEGMGGTIGYTSNTEGNETGTTFYFDLPSADDSGAEKPPEEN